MRQLKLIGAALLLLSSARVAHASPLLELTGGFGGMGGLQARHTGPSAASAYFNPALLTHARTGLSAGILVLNSDIAVQVGARSPNSAVPDGLTDAYHGAGRTPIPSKPLPTELLQFGRPGTANQTEFKPRPRQHQGSGHETLPYVAVGAVLNVKKKVSFGFYGLVPIKDFLTMHSYYVDEREQSMTNSLHPEMYSDRLTALSFAFAAGAQITKTFSLGVGATLGLNAIADAPVYVASVSNLGNLDANIDVKAKIAITPHLGAAWNPGKRWHLTGTVHAPQQLGVKAGFTFSLAGGATQSSGLSWVYYSQPWQVSGGLGYDFYVEGDTVWTVSGQALYQRWSKYIDRQGVRPAGAYEWMDTMTGAVGLRMKDGPISLGLDGQYKPSPVPDQTGRTNYVDNDRLGANIAAQYDFTLWDIDLALGAQFQLYRMLERRVKKIVPPTADGVNHTPQLVWDEVPDDTMSLGKAVTPRDGVQSNNPGWPGYKSLGWVSSGGVYLTVFL